VKKGILPVLISAALFGLMHMMLVQSVYTFLMGFVAGIIYSKKRNLLYPIAIHMTNNLISSIQAAFPQSGTIINVIVIAMILPAGYCIYRIWKQKENKTVSPVSGLRIS
jgi:membrane protease YdiL (CAAX protease family)